MEGREGMALSGSPPFYLNRGVGGSGPIHVSGTQTGAPPPPSFRTLPNPNIPVQTNVKDSHVGLAYQSDPLPDFGHDPSPNFGHGISMGVASSVTPGDPGKKKRGRPRKYGPDGANMSLGLSPLSLNPSLGDITSIEKDKKNRGRPKGSGRKQQLASLGEWMNGSAGMAFTPHVIHIAVGEDITSKILLFAQQRPRALCILSATGSVSAVTLRHSTSSGGTHTFEGRFEILCLSGNYLLSEEGGSRERTGGLSISVCSPDGLVVGGAIGGRLISASLVQVVVCSFVYGGSKPKHNLGADAKGDQNSEALPAEKATPINAVPIQNLAPNSGMDDWPPSPRPDVMRDPNTEIDLTSG